MPEYLTPGVFIEEIPGSNRTIVGAATSITAFVGRTARGPVSTPIRIRSPEDFTRIFGGLWQVATLGYAVSHYFANGGSDALIVRVFSGDTENSTATISLKTDGPDLVLKASSPGSWGSTLRVSVDHRTSDPANATLINLLIEEVDDSNGTTAASEFFQNISTESTQVNFLETVLNEQSELVKDHTRPSEGAVLTDSTVDATGTAFDDGGEITDADIVGSRDERSGIYALENAQPFNLLCIPPLSRSTDVSNATWAMAAAYCLERRAMLLVDAPSNWSVNPDTSGSDAESGINTLVGMVGNAAAKNTAAYYPRLRAPDPLADNRLADFAACGAIAGVISRIDSQRGVWKAPAGRDASLSLVQELSVTLTSEQSSVLNRSGLNCLRSFPGRGHFVWGARTLEGTDWKYVQVRRLALYIEQSVIGSIGWVAFEHNNESLWSQIHRTISDFMHDLFRQGAFMGRSATDAYIVKCDRETTTQDDINRGVVNVLVGIAPLRPAEFLIIRIKLLVGPVQA
jgi:phage tail sheath protein FI